MIRRIDPDEAVTLNGVPVTGRQLAEVRQELSHRGVHNPRWAELSQYDQDTAAISAGSWLRALAELVPAAAPAATCVCCGTAWPHVPSSERCAPPVADQVAAREGYGQAVATLRGVEQRTGSPAARWAADYLATDPDKLAPGATGSQADRTPEGYDITACRSCNAPIVWAITSRDKGMPVDAEPVDDGNVELQFATVTKGQTPIGQTPYATVLTGPSLFGGPLRKSHFASCPSADEWRKPQ